MSTSNRRSTAGGTAIDTHNLVSFMVDLPPGQRGLRVIEQNPAVEGCPEQVEADVVHINATGMTPVTSYQWENRGRPMNWITHHNMIPRTLEGIRVRHFQFGYRSGWLRSPRDISNTSVIVIELLDSLLHARKNGDQTRPLVIVAHGYGGIIWYYALLVAMQPGIIYKDIAVSFRAMISLSVPWWGGNFAEAVEQLKKEIVIQEGLAADELFVVPTVEPGCCLLEELELRFHDFYKDQPWPEMHFFLEGQPTKLRDLVPGYSLQSSAECYIAGELPNVCSHADRLKQMSRFRILPRTYVDMIKFNDHTHSDWIAFSISLRKAVLAAARPAARSAVRPTTGPVSRSHMML